MVIAIISNVADEPHPRRLIIDEPGADTLASDKNSKVFRDQKRLYYPLRINLKKSPAAVNI